MTQKGNQQYATASNTTASSSTTQQVNTTKRSAKITATSTTDEGASTKCHPTVYIIFFSLLLDLLAFTMILPLLPSILEYYRNNDPAGGLYHRLLHHVQYFQTLVGAPAKYESVLFGGIIGSMYSMLQFVTSPIMGGLSDAYGRKPVMLVCLIGIASSYGLWACSHNFTLFVLARIIGGLSKGNISLSMSIIADVSTPQSRNRGMALVGIAFSLGFIVGPMIGATFAAFADKTSQVWFWCPAMFALTLAVADLLFVAICMKETLPKENRSKVEHSLSRNLEFISIRSLFKFTAVRNMARDENKALCRIGLIYFIYLFIYSGLEFTVTFLMYHNFGFTSIDQAKVFLTTGIVMAVLQGGVVRRLPEHLNKKAAVIGLYLIVPAFIVVGLARNKTMLYAGMVLFAISTAFVVTCMTTLVSKFGNVQQKGTVLGIYRSLGALARALGPTVASVAFWIYGSTFTYIAGGVLLLIPTLMLQRTDLRKYQ